MSNKIFLFFLLLIQYGNSFGQSYGLGFNSHEVVQDQRTGLDLSPGKTLCFDRNFEVVFDIAFISGTTDYFGYIARFVGDNNQNIDFIYDSKMEEKNHFKVVMGDHFPSITFNIPATVLFSKWSTIKFRFDYDKKTLVVSSGKFSAATQLTINRQTCFKILFGANEYLGFKTNDVPPMKIRNIRINENETQKYFWPLDEHEGQVAEEQIQGKSALVNNPLWVKKLHYDWQLVKSGKLSGEVSVAFDAKNETVLFVAPDTLLSYNLKKNKFNRQVYASGRQNLMEGNQSVYSDETGKLINFYYDQKVVSTFDPGSGRWTKNFVNLSDINYWHHNKFYNPQDSSLYIIGGYGHFVYKNQIDKYHFPSNSWSQVKYTGDTLVPRYLAALGRSSKGAYIMGGYGSSTGRQILNPRNLYDLLYFDAAKKTIKKIYDLKIDGEDFVFANSMIVNEKSKTYYALIFPKHKYRSNLQLIEGSLEKPEFAVKGNQIPYLFQDISSYADLYYCPESKRFLAVTLFSDKNGETNFNIYTLYSPPIDGQSLAQAAATKDDMPLILVAVVVFILLVLFVLYRIRKRKAAVVLPLAEVGKPVSETPAAPIREEVVPATEQNAIFLFGDMQVFDRTGNEITKQFTPLIKELFLIILLYTIRWKRGISSEKLKDLLWMDKSVESARNNRSVNIAKLKNILEKISDCEVSMETGYWRINFNPQTTYVDYQEYFDIANSKNQLSKDKILQLIKIIKKGSFLSTSAYDWMDTFKSEISNEIIDVYLSFARSVQIHEDPELLIEVANYVFYFDSVNEEAMVVKCKALAHLGKHSQCRNTYENFCKEYKLLYDSDFPKNFNAVLNSNLEEL